MSGGWWDEWYALDVWEVGGLCQAQELGGRGTNVYVPYAIKLGMRYAQACGKRGERVVHNKSEDRDMHQQLYSIVG